MGGVAARVWAEQTQQILEQSLAGVSEGLDVVKRADQLRLADAQELLSLGRGLLDGAAGAADLAPNLIQYVH